VDNRIALNRFNEFLLNKEQVEYPHVMVIDGNDERGIDVGVLTRYEISSICSHVDDQYKSTNGKFYKIFSRDCPEYKIDIGNGKFVHLLCNHLKSKGYGTQASSDAKRKRQAKRIAKILENYDLTQDLVVVAGDFNDTPGSQPLKDLMNVPNLFDVLNSPLLNGPRWTYHTGNQQIDYLLVSRPIWDNLTKVEIERRGIFKQGNISFPEVTNKVTQSSDHAAILAEFNV
jgi:endonuclease/exonuclease/phosphatase family metal-dependent hydrolase